MKTTAKKTAPKANGKPGKKGTVKKTAKPKPGTWDAILRSMEFAKKHPIKFVNGW